MFQPQNSQLKTEVSQLQDSFKVGKMLNSHPKTVLNSNSKVEKWNAKVWDFKIMFFFLRNN